MKKVLLFWSIMLWICLLIFATNVLLPAAEKYVDSIGSCEYTKAEIVELCETIKYDENSIINNDNR